MNIGLAKGQKSIAAMLGGVGVKSDHEDDEEKLKIQQERDEIEDKMSAYEQ